MRGPKLILLVALVAASACDHGPATSESLARTAPATVALAPASPITELSPGFAATDTTALDALPWDERIAFERALAASDAHYAPRMDEGGPVLETPGSVVATVTASGAHFSFGGHETTLRVAAVGREGAMRPAIASGRPEVLGPEVRTARGAGVTEWWRSLPSGLEHGVTIAERPPGDGVLTVEVAVTGDLSAHRLSDDAVELRDSSGTRVATYAHLIVLDASGDRVPARMSTDGARVALVIDDSGARYPLVVDPLVTAEEATLLAPDGVAGDELGEAVALSSDGSRALVGAVENRSGGTGTARVFFRMGATWVHEATLVGPTSVDNRFGASVALSADGTHALVGAYLDNTAGGTDAGSSLVFLRTGTTWALEATLLAPDGAPGDLFGISVALAADGSRALVGATNDDTARGSNTGSARVFLRTGTTWAQEATLLAPDGAADDTLGRTVALSSDGTRALLGADGDDTPRGSAAGSARVFLRTGTTWVQEATLIASDGAPNDFLGRSIALSFDGSRALAGATWDDTAVAVDSGSARVFLRTGATWTEEATLLARDGAVDDRFGFSVALSSDGSRALVGSPFSNTALALDAGSARMFVRTGTPCVPTSDETAPSGYLCTDRRRMDPTCRSLPQFLVLKIQMESTPSASPA